MTKSKNDKVVMGIVAVIVVALGLFGFRANETKSVGGNLNSVIVDFAQGISVNGTQVISNTGAYLRSFTGTSGTFSGALGVTGSTTVSTFTQGGGVTATTTTATLATLAVTDFDTENVIDVTPGGASLILTIPASSTLTSFIPTAGQVRSIYVRNATTSAGVNLTIAGNTGVLLKTASSTAVIQSSTASSTYARLDFLRKANSDISVLMTTFGN